MSDARFLLAEWLLEAGAGASARAMLGGLRGARANRLRERSARVRLAPGVYALLAETSDEAAATLPLHPEPGRSRAAAPDLRAACDLASDLVRRRLGVPSLPAFHFPFDEWLAASGPSLGLPAFLAFVAHLVPDRALDRPVHATGRLDADGRVHPVGHLPSKVAAARREAPSGLILVPDEGALGELADGSAADELRPIRTVDEALEVVFGPGPLTPDPSLFRVDILLARARAHDDPNEALRLLEAVEPSRLANADRVQLHWELGTRLRHVGRTEEAARHHAAAREQLAAQRGTLGAELAERYDIEAWSTRLSQHHVREVVEAVGERLERPFLAVGNELRARGLLAFAHGVAGDSARAVQVRAGNLPLHDSSAHLASSRPFTLCYLTLDAARAGDAAAFDRYGAMLCQETPPGDAKQWRYHAMALVRGLVHLRREDDALAWAEDRARFAGARAPASLVHMLRDGGPIADHPEISTARGLVRAFGRSDRLDEAETLAGRVLRGQPGLKGWIAGLVHLELAAQLDRVGRRDEARGLARETTRWMGECERSASDFHREAIEGDPRGLEIGLDRVWY